MGYACSKNTISDYLLYLERSFFLHQSLIYSPKAKDRMQYPRKVYFVDNGFLRFLSLSADEPRLLENLVAMEIVRRGRELSYWRGGKGEEVDVVISERGKPTQLIQVCHTMTLRETREREVRSLCRGIAESDLKEGVILTFDTEETIRESGFLIRVQPVWKWLLAKW
jgi:predicted AAA+ superfamily ATPase